MFAERLGFPYRLIEVFSSSPEVEGTYFAWKSKAGLNFEAQEAPSSLVNWNVAAGHTKNHTLPIVFFSSGFCPEFESNRAIK